MPYLSYCCEVWGNNYKKKIHCISVLQKRAMRMIGNLAYRDHSAPIFVKFKALNIFDIVKMKSASILYMAYYERLPMPLQAFFLRNSSINISCSRNKHDFKVNYRRTNLKAMCLSNVGVKIWNNIDLSLRQSANINIFKRNYKTCLINTYT